MQIRARVAVWGVLVVLGAGILAPSAEARQHGRGHGMGRGRAVGQQRGSVSARDYQFMVTAARDGLAEVRLGRMATQRGQSQDVRSFGRQMVQDHSAANSQLMELARSKGARLPTDPGPHQAMINQLPRLSGRSFDRAYMRMMVQDHRKAVALFRRQSSQGDDPDLRAWAAQTLPTLQIHRQMAEDVARQVGVRRSARR